MTNKLLVKISLIGFGLLAVSFALIKHLTFENPGMVMGTAPSNGVTITGILGMVAAAVGFFMELQKAVPSELIAKLKDIFKGGKMDIGVLAELLGGKYGKLDFEELKKLFDHFKNDEEPVDNNIPNKDLQIFRNVIANISSLKMLEEMFKKGVVPASVKIVMTDGQEFSFDFKAKK